jgi:hypothetical protein
LNRFALADELSDLLSREQHSLATHLEEATPYLTPRTYKLWRRIRDVIHAETDHVGRLSLLLDRLELPMRPSPRDPVVASYHFSKVDTLVPLLLDEKREHIAAYERAIEHAGHDEEIASELRTLLAENQHELAELEAVAAELQATQPA